MRSRLTALARESSLPKGGYPARGALCAVRPRATESVIQCVQVPARDGTATVPLGGRRRGFRSHCCQPCRPASPESDPMGCAFAVIRPSTGNWRAIGSACPAHKANSATLAGVSSEAIEVHETCECSDAHAIASMLRTACRTLRGTCSGNSRVQPRPGISWQPGDASLRLEDQRPGSRAQDRCL